MTPLIRRGTLRAQMKEVTVVNGIRMWPHVVPPIAEIAHDAQTIESCLFASLTQHRLLWRLVSVTGPRRELQT